MPLVSRSNHSVSVGKKKMLIKFGICGKMFPKFTCNIHYITEVRPVGADTCGQMDGREEANSSIQDCARTHKNEIGCLKL
jgi:hypothetical protein